MISAAVLPERSSLLKSIRLRHPALYPLGAAVLFGASTPFAKLLLTDLEPLPLAAFLYLGSGLGILPFLLIRDPARTEKRLRRKDLPWLLGAIAAGGILAPVALLYGLDQTPASTASLLLNFEVVATALFAVLLFREEITRRVSGAILILVMGSVLLSWNGGAFGFSLGALGVVLATVLWGVDNNLTCVIAGRDPLIIATLKGFIAGGVLAVAMIAFSLPPPDIFSLVLALLLGFISYGLSTILFVLSLRSMGSTRTSTYFSIAPFVGAVISLAIFPQIPSILFLGAVLLMLIGVVLLARETHIHLHQHFRILHEHPHRRDDRYHQHPHEEEGIPPEPPKDGAYPDITDIPHMR
jgi:drug/metabolite transporter (DMT)-like permease